MATTKELQAQLDEALAQLAERPATTDEAPAINVIDAINRVKRDLPGIGKTDSSRDVPYHFRGIETLTAHLQPLTAKHGIVIMPCKSEELPSSYEYSTSTNSVWHETHIHFQWAVYGPGGCSDVIYGESIGYGRDRDDKGASKAQTQAFKEFLIKLFCIGDKSADPDANVSEEQTRSGTDTSGRVYGSGQPAQNAGNFVDWHALGWAVSPTPNDTEAADARATFEKTMTEIATELKKLDEGTQTKLRQDRTKIIGPLPYSTAQVSTWAGMVDAALNEMEAAAGQIEAAFEGTTDASGES